MPPTNRRCTRTDRLRALLHTTVVALAVVCSPSPSFAQADFEYVVRPGDNPWNISTRFLKHINYWPRLQAYNQIQLPRAIPPGTRLRIPQSWLGSLQITAEVVDLHGKVEFHQGGLSGLLERGSTLSSGTRIRTHSNSSSTILFPDGSYSLIGENSEFILQDLSRLKLGDSQRVLIYLNQGMTENKVEPRSPSGSRYRIQTPAAIAAVRGTEFRVDVAGSEMRTETRSGAVNLHNRRGQTMLNAATGGVVSASNASPSKATPLLPAPDLNSLPTRISHLPFRVDFPAVDNAQQYRSQLRPARELSALVFEQLNNEPFFTGSTDLPDGDYIIRVSAVDHNGLGGLPAETHLSIDARPEPPFPLQPRAGQHVSSEQIDFRWAKLPSAIHYHFQLADNADFDRPLIDLDQLVSNHHQAGQDLPAGPYFWRIAVSTPEGRGPWSSVQQFIRPGSGPSPQLEAIGDRLQVRWRDNELSPKFNIQLSRNIDFTTISLDRISEQASIDFTDLDAGEWYVRVREIGADDLPGRWGQAQQIDIKRSHWSALFLLLPFLLAL